MSEFRPETKVLLQNLTSWNLYFKRVSGVGDIKIPAGIKSFGIAFEEIQMQIQIGNTMFTGTDGFGSHARIRIIDDAARAALFGIEGEEASKPSLLTVDSVRELLGVRNREAFAARLEELAVTDAEKRMVGDLAKEAGVANAEAWKVEAIEKASGYTLTISEPEQEQDASKSKGKSKGKA
jgi:hypothetical protein